MLLKQNRLLYFYNNLLRLIWDGGKWGEGYLCPTNHTARMTTKTISIKIAYCKIFHILYKDILPGSPCQDSAGNWTILRPPDHCKEMQTEAVWTCLLFIRSGQNRLARHSKRGKKTKQTEEEVGGQHQGIDRPGIHQVPEGRENREKWIKLVVNSSVVPL